MKKTVAALAIGVMAWWPVNANAKMKGTVAKTNENLVVAVSDEESSKVNSTKVVSFEEEAKKLQKNKEVVKAIMKNKRVQEMVKICWQERLERLFYELLSDEKTMNDISELFADENVKNTLESIADELNHDLAEQYRWEYVKDIIDKVLEQRIDLLKFFGQFKDSDLQKTLKEWNKEKVKQIIESEHISVFEWLMLLFIFVWMIIFGAIGETNDLWRNAVKRAQEEEQKKKKK